MFDTIIITTPTIQQGEADLLNSFFLAGCPKVHIRKPDACEQDVEELVKGIIPRFRKRVVISYFPELFRKYRLGGLHLSSKEWKKMSVRPEAHFGASVSVSCHTFDEIDHLPFKADYAYLSPVFDSISKQGYQSHFDLNECAGFNAVTKTPIVALGGISSENIHQIKSAGFSGAAVLGYIWSNPGEELMRLKNLLTPHILTIGGLDPSGGAGITKDVAVANDFSVRAYPIVTAITYQNEKSYFGTKWLSYDEVVRQIDSIKDTAFPLVAKIGLIGDLDMLLRLEKYLKDVFPSIKIVWDPILKSSTGETFHHEVKHFEEILRLTDIITPNLPEARILFGEDFSDDSLRTEAKEKDLAILYKGGHSEGNIVVDKLITGCGQLGFSLIRSGKGKHGTGCTHSTALASSLALGCNVSEAAGKAQIYVSTLLRSSDSLLSTPRVLSENHPLYEISQVRHMFITHPSQDNPPVLKQIELACQMGAEAVQLRMKDASDQEMLEVAYQAKEICHMHGVIFTINDRVHIARQVAADGVHLGQDDGDISEARKMLGEGAVVGRTCNTPEQAVQAVLEGADYLGVGPFRFTTTKQKLAEVLGLEGYRKLLSVLKEKNLEVPVFAIGGITEFDEPDLFRSGITGIAVSGDFIRKMKQNAFK